MFIKVGIIIMRKLSKGKPSTSRLPSRFTNLIVLEDTATLSQSCKKGDLPKAPLCLVTGVPIKKIWETIQVKPEVTLSTSDFYALIEYEGNSKDLTCSKLSTIESQTGMAWNFFMKKRNVRERRAVYNRVWRSKRTDMKQVCLIVTNRTPFTDDTLIKITGIVFKDISAKKTTFCKLCDTPFTRLDSLKRHEENDTACTTETVIKPISKEYGC